MFGWLLTNLTDRGSLEYLLSSPFALVLFGFQIWMLIHAIRNREWMWAFFILIGWGISALFYYFYVYRAAPSAMPSHADIVAAFRLTGYFLARHVFDPRGLAPPPARTTFLTWLDRAAREAEPA